MDKSETVKKIEGMLDKALRASEIDFSKKSRSKATVAVNGTHMLLLQKNGEFTVVKYESQEVHGVIGGEWNIFAPTAVYLLVEAGVLTIDEYHEFKQWFQNTHDEDQKQRTFKLLKQTAADMGYDLVPKRKCEEYIADSSFWR